MYINIDTVTIRSFDKTRWDDEIKECEEIPIEDREYEIVAIDKNVHDIWEFAQLVEYWHRRLPYVDGLDFHFTSSGDE